MTAEDTRALVTAAFADTAIDLATALRASLALREGLRSVVLASLSRADCHPAVGEVPGVLTYRDGDQVRSAKLSPESELLVAAVLDR